MSKTGITTLFIFTSLLFLSACGGKNTSTAVTDKPTDLFEYEQRTLDQAKALEEALKKSSNHGDQLGLLE